MFENSDYFYRNSWLNKKLTNIIRMFVLIIYLFTTIGIPTMSVAASDNLDKRINYHDSTDIEASELNTDISHQYFFPIVFGGDGLPPGNSAPVGDSQTVSTLRDVPIDITLTGSDIDGDELIFLLESFPSHGNLTGSLTSTGDDAQRQTITSDSLTNEESLTRIAPDLLYTPDPGFIGVDSFTFRVTDGEFICECATVTIYVNEVEVSGSIAWDPGQTGGVAPTIVGDTVTFDGEIEYYTTADGPPADGNYVGVEITAPAGFDTTGSTLTIGTTTYNWDDVNDGDNFVWWYPKVTTTPETFTATVEWNSASTQIFTIEIAASATLVPPPDTTLPTLEGVSPAEGDVVLSADGTFIWTVDALDNNLYELEIDHNLEGSLPEFSVYASESDPYGGDESEFTAAGVSVTYDAMEQKWTIDFGADVTDLFILEGGITFYVVLKDEAGNKWGSMSPTTSENTFAYAVSREPL